MTAVVPLELTTGGAAEATPWVLAMFDCIVFSSESFADADCFGSFTTTVSGPFTPAPKPDEIRS